MYTQLHVGHVGRAHNAIDNIFKSGKRSGHPHIMGKAIPQMGPTVADTLFKEFSTGLGDP